MRRIVYSPAALADLQNIKATILENFGDEEIAVKSLQKLMKRIDGLVDFPGMGLELQRVTGIQTDYQYLFCKPDYVFYRIEGDIVRIIRVLNEKQDYMRILFGICEIEEDEE